MKKYGIVVLCFLMLLSACSKKKEKEEVKEPEVVERFVLSDEQYKQIQPNELGRVPVLMYHRVTSDKEALAMDSLYTVSPETFMTHMQMLYDHGFVPVSLDDYVQGTMDLEAGKRPFVMTFDDGNRDNFQASLKDGQLEIDPECAIGLMEQCRELYGWNMQATFFLNEDDFFEYNQYKFDQRETCIKEKLEWLVDHGYHLGNHTATHVYLPDIQSDEQLKGEIGRVEKRLKEYLPDYTMKYIALPFGSSVPASYEKSLFDGEYEGISYHYEAALEVGWMPERSPYHVYFGEHDYQMEKGRTGTYLMRTRGWTTPDSKQEPWDVAYAIEYCVDQGNGYVSDGMKDRVSYPQDWEDSISKTKEGMEYYPY